MTANGVASDWQPLATLVRLPVFKDLQCPANSALACKLSGSNLFLVDSVSSDPQFSHPVQVPDGFPGYALPVPHPTDGQLYVKLRDDPSVVHSATLSAQQLPPSPDESLRTLARQAAVHTEDVPVVGPDATQPAASQRDAEPAERNRHPPATAAPVRPQPQINATPNSKGATATQAKNET